MSMQQLSLREVQLEELNLLKDFDQFCKKYNLKYKCQQKPRRRDPQKDAGRSYCRA